MFMSCGPQQQNDQLVSLDDVTLLFTFALSLFRQGCNTDALCTMLLPQPQHSCKHKDVLVPTWLGQEKLTDIISLFDNFYMVAAWFIDGCIIHQFNIVLLALQLIPAFAS